MDANISYGSIRDLETQTLLAGELGFIKKGELDTAKQDINEIEKMHQVLIKTIKTKPLNPWPLESLDPRL